MSGYSDEWEVGKYFNDPFDSKIRLTSIPPVTNDNREGIANCSFALNDKFTDPPMNHDELNCDSLCDWRFESEPAQTDKGWKSARVTTMGSIRM